MSVEQPITAAQSQAALRWLGRIQQQPAQAEGAAFKRWLLESPPTARPMPRPRRFGA